MSTRTTSTEHGVTGLTKNNRTGLALAAFLGVLDVVSLAFPTPDGETGPPLGILIIGFLLGLATLALVHRAWTTGSRKAIRAVVGLRVFSIVTALPAFFVDVDAWIKVLVAAAVLLTLTSLVLMLGRERGASAIQD